MSKAQLPSNNPGPSDGASVSCWQRTTPAPELPRLTQDVACDVCVVGAGIAGLSAAYFLAREGRAVTVVDQGSGVGAGESGRTTAHLTQALDDRYYILERLHGVRGARMAADSHTSAISAIEAIVRVERIACDFERVDGYLFASPGRPDDELWRELEATRRAGLPTSLVEDPPLRLGPGDALRFPAQAQLDPMKYLVGLAAACNKLGVRIHGSAHVDELAGGSTARVQTAAGPVVTAGAVVVATNSPINDQVVIHTKQAPYRTYAIACQVRRGSVPRGLYWDTLRPYHYVRLMEGGDRDAFDLIVVGGEDHKTGQWGGVEPAERWRALEAWTRRRFAVEEVVSRWSGQVMEPVDLLGYAGHNPMDEDNVYVVTGDSGNGMTHGTLAGVILRDLILGRDNPWADLYDPARKSLRAAPVERFVRENLNTAGQYLDWIERGSVRSIDEIAPGQGAVVRHGLRLAAVHVDAAGVRTMCSAACPHMGCAVRWNPGEQSWDCPCHGSRFDAHGKVIEGPAIADLAPFDPDGAEDAVEVVPEQPVVS